MTAASSIFTAIVSKSNFTVFRSLSQPAFQFFVNRLNQVEVVERQLIHSHYLHAHAVSEQDGCCCRIVLIRAYYFLLACSNFGIMMFLRANFLLVCLAVTGSWLCLNRVPHWVCVECCNAAKCQREGVRPALYRRHWVSRTPVAMASSLLGIPQTVTAVVSKHLGVYVLILAAWSR